MLPSERRAHGLSRTGEGRPKGSPTVAGGRGRPRDCPRTVDHKTACRSPKPHPTRSSVLETVHRSEPLNLVGGRRSSDRHSPRLALPGQTESRSGRVSGAAELDLWCALGGREDGGGGLRRPANVAMMQTADFGHLPDPSRLGELDGPDVGCVLVEREMRAGLVVVREVPGQDAAEVSLAEDEHVIQASPRIEPMSRSA